MGMLIRIGYVVNYVLGRDVAGRTVAKFPDDKFLVAYPGSGGQWLRRLVANMTDPAHPVSNDTIIERVPDPYHGSRRRFKRIKRPRIIFSHECYDAGCHGRVVYLVRDPRDVAVSIYQQRRKGAAHRDRMTLEKFVSTEFMRTDQFQGGWAEDFSGVIPPNAGFFYRSRLKEEFLGTPASWGENVMSWLGARGENPELLLMVRYEELFAHPEDVLGRISEFLDLGASTENICAAVRVSRENSCAEAAPTPGKWETELSARSLADIETAWGPLMSLLEYFPSARSQTVEEAQKYVEHDAGHRLSS
jgi:Sulfotransferase domain